LALNPNGHIPVLQDEGVVVWESMACALYLADNYKGPDGLNLAAQNKAESAEILRWTFWVVTECEKDALTILMHTLVMPADRRKPELVAQAVSRLAGPLRVIEQHLASQSSGAAYLAGERFTVADIAVASVLAWLKPAPELLAACPATAAWLARCLDRPAQLQVRALARKG
jgi:glutathione S-transferase